MSPEIEKLLGIIEEKLGWGESKAWQSRDFENLNQLILDETGVSLSASTLRRIWGKVEYKHLPSVTTMDTLAKFAGYENWRTFQKQNTRVSTHQHITAGPVVHPTVKSTAWRKLVWLFVIVFGLGLGTIFWVKKSKPSIKPGNYSFSSRPVTRKIPNSVIFTYDAAASPTDSVYIQQSWDGRTRTLVDKKLHQYTAIYYEPGFYHAKLFVDTQVVKEHPLMIPTDGWLGLISNKMIPVYLEPNEFIFTDSLQIGIDKIEKKNMLREPMPPAVKYYNVGNFDPVSINDFSFSAEIKNEYSEGAAACQFSNIFLYTDDVPIYIPLSVPGCVSELNLMNREGEMISGKKTDLSAFGTDFSTWVNVSCKSVPGKIQYWINNKLAYEFSLPGKEVKILGLSFAFQGTGAVKDIQLKQGNKIVFGAF